MVKTRLAEHESEVLFEVKRLLPGEVMNDIERICRQWGASLASLSEVRLSAVSLSSVVISGRSTPLSVRLGYDDIGSIMSRACEMAVFAHRDDIANGFITLKGGGRVGVCGYAKYDGGRLVGISTVSTLVFRIPTGKCDFADKLHAFWRERGYSGMLIASAAGVGKTTAIRAMAAMAGSRRSARRVVVVDERCEFDPSLYRDCTVDILRGYKRRCGIEIAIRTMSADIIIVDEIGNGEDCDALMLAVGAGVGVVATAHGDDLRSLCKRIPIGRLVEAGLFSSYALITVEEGDRKITLGDISELQ